MVLLGFLLRLAGVACFLVGAVWFFGTLMLIAGRGGAMGMSSTTTQATRHDYHRREGSSDERPPRHPWIEFTPPHQASGVLMTEFQCPFA
jgi:hypothetical protein